jgi:hypothetical protein
VLLFCQPPSYQKFSLKLMEICLLAMMASTKQKNVFCSVTTDQAWMLTLQPISNLAIVAKYDECPLLALLLSLPQPTEPNQCVHADLFIPLKTSDSGKKFVLCMTDALTKCVELVPLPNKEAATVTEAIFDKWFCHFGVLLILSQIRSWPIILCSSILHSMVKYLKPIFVQTFFSF